MVDGATRYIKLERDRQSTIDADLHKLLRMKKGVPFKRIEKLIGKLRHAATSVPTGKNMMTPINKIMQVKPSIFWWKYFPDAKQEFRD